MNQEALCSIGCDIREEKMTRKTQDEELEAVADMLEMLALEVRAITGSSQREAVPVHTQISEEFCSGRRVRIVVCETNIMGAQGCWLINGGN
jgi:hypothetical protein